PRHRRPRIRRPVQHLRHRSGIEGDVSRCLGQHLQERNDGDAGEEVAVYAAVLLIGGTERTRPSSATPRSRKKSRKAMAAGSSTAGTRSMSSLAWRRRISPGPSPVVDGRSSCTFSSGGGLGAVHGGASFGESCSFSNHFCI